MRILVISNLYPPRCQGGYEIGCRQAVEGLRSRGHQVQVLTSAPPASPAEGEGVWRWLAFDPDVNAGLSRLAWFCFLVRRQRLGERAIHRAIRAFKPDIVYCWNMAGIPLGMLTIVSRYGIPICAYAFDCWLAKSELDPWNRFLNMRRSKHNIVALWLAKLCAGFPVEGRAVQFSAVQFCSEYVHKECVQGPHQITASACIPWGVGTEWFRPLAEPVSPTRMLFAGRLVPDKGVDTAIDALAALRGRGYPAATLTVVGTVSDPDYLARLERQVDAHGLRDGVVFRPPVSHGVMAELYVKHGVLLFCSRWEEPFGLTLLEAMACGLPVVASPSGGSREILDDGGNALLFPRNDANACARRVADLLESPGLRNSIRTTARKEVQARYCLDHTLDSIDTQLRSVLK